METLVLIIAELNTDSAIIENLKDQIISYLGERMIKEKISSFSAIMVNSEISEFDKSVIAGMADNKNMTVLFIESEDVNFSGSKVVTLTMKKE